MKKEDKVVVEENSKKERIKSIVELILIILAVIIILIFFPNTFIWDLVVLFLILSILIFVHEFGHFIMGKAFGVYIYEFALGMGPKVMGFKRKNDPTEYNLRALPIGGFCQMAGEEGEDDKNLRKDQFMCNKSKLQRTLILVAGVVMNFITAIILLFFISLVWGNTEQSSVIGQVEENSPAAEAGIVSGDRVTGLNGYNVSTWDELTIVTNLKNESGEYTYEIEHKDGSKESITLTPAEYIVVGNDTYRITEDNTREEILEELDLESGEVEVRSLIGISADSTVKHGFLNAIDYAFTKFKSIISTMFLIIGSLFTGKLGLEALSGPVGMYSIIDEVAALGVANIIYLAAYLSINLGVINILPFPAFDGGRVLFVIIEAITRKKVNPVVEGWFHTIGFILLMILMLYITFQDVLRLF